MAVRAPTRREHLRHARGKDIVVKALPTETQTFTVLPRHETELPEATLVHVATKAPGGSTHRLSPQVSPRRTHARSASRAAYAAERHGAAAVPTTVAFAVARIEGGRRIAQAARADLAPMSQLCGQTPEGQRELSRTSFARFWNEWKRRAPELSDEEAESIAVEAVAFARTLAGSSRRHYRRRLERRRPYRRTPGGRAKVLPFRAPQRTGR